MDKSSVENRSSPSVSSDSAGDKQIGVIKAEGAAKVFKGRLKWFLFLGIGLASYIYSLDGTTTWTYLSWAQSSFGKHSLLATIQVAQGVIIAVGKPIVAKIADATSRFYAYIAVLLFYVIGYSVIASANSTDQLAGGIVVYAMGYTGLQVLTSIIVADITTLRFRGLVSALTSAPFILNAFVSGFISESVLGPDKQGWRWGYGMFAILVPVALSPLITTLGWAEHKAKKLGYIEPQEAKSLPQRLLRAFHDIDAIGLVFLAAGVSMLLLPLTLANNAKGRWNNPSMIAMIVLGPVFLAIFAAYEWKFAPRPLAPGRLWNNRTVALASLIGFFDFVSFYLTFTYLYSFVYITQPTWSLRELTYFSNTQTVALTVFGIMAGVIMTFTRRFKWLLVAGLVVRLAGCGMMIHSRGAQGSTAELVITQVMQGFGGGIAAVTSSVGAQASVVHKDVAVTIALVLLITEIGGVVGNAISGSIWSNTMPGQLAEHLPFLNQTEIDTLFGSIFIAGTFPEGSPVRVGVITAYDYVMKIMLIAATAIAVVPLGLALLMPDWHLGDGQNAVDQKDITGSTVEKASDPESPAK